MSGERRCRLESVSRFPSLETLERHTVFFEKRHRPARATRPWCSSNTATVFQGCVLLTKIPQVRETLGNTILRRLGLTTILGARAAIALFGASAGGLARAAELSSRREPTSTISRFRIPLVFEFGRDRCRTLDDDGKKSGLESHAPVLESFKNDRSSDSDLKRPRVPENEMQIAARLLGVGASERRRVSARSPRSLPRRLFGETIHT